MEGALPEENQNDNRPNVITIESIYIDLDGAIESQHEERDCEHFSIRGYTAGMRTKDIGRCNIFESDDNQNNSNEETPILPPLTVGKFKSWNCSNCLSAAVEAAEAGSLSTPTGSAMPPPPSDGLVILQPDSDPTPPMQDNPENPILLSDDSGLDPTPPVPDNLENVIVLSDSGSDPTPPVPDNLENVVVLSDSDSEPTPLVLENAITAESNENQEIGHPECDEMEAHPSSPIQQTHSEAGLDTVVSKGKAVVKFGEPSRRSDGATQNLECETPKVADTADEARADAVENHADETPISAENAQRDGDDDEEDDVNYPRNPRKMRLLTELSAPNRGRRVAVRGNDHRPRWSGDGNGKRKMDQETCPPRRQSKRYKTFVGDSEISESGPIDSGGVARRRSTLRLHLEKPTQLFESNQMEIETNAEKDSVDQNEKLNHTIPAASDAQNLILLGKGGISHQQDFLNSDKNKNKNITLEPENDDMSLDTIEMNIVEMMATRMYTCKQTMQGNDAQLCPPVFKHKEIDLKTYARGAKVSQLACLWEISMPCSSNVVKLFSPSNHEPKQGFDKSIQEQSKVNFHCMRPPPSLFAHASKQRGKLPTLRPRERKSCRLDMGICSFNKNPAEFTVPASTNEFMISGADLKLIN